MRRFLLILIAATTLPVSYAFFEARRDPVIRRATIAMPGWPKDAAPVRVALLSDIHIGGPAMPG